MKVLITGSLGHIGSSLMEKFKGVADELILVDSLITQRYPSCFNLNVKHQFYRLDISDDQNLQRLTTLIGFVDVVIHLAARTDAAGSAHDPIGVENNNYLSTKNVANISKTLNKPLIHISSTSVYGTQKNLVDENCLIDDLKPQSPYAATKLKEEAFLNELGKEGLEFNILRFGTIYGYSTGMRFHTAVNKFAWQAAHNEDISVWTTALHQVRPYLYVGDAVNCLVKLCLEKKFNNEITNIVSQNMTVNGILEELRKHYPKLKIKFVDSPIMNQLSYDVCNKKSLDLGIEYTGDIEKGIKEIVELFRGLKNKY